MNKSLLIWIATAVLLSACGHSEPHNVASAVSEPKAVTAAASAASIAASDSSWITDNGKASSVVPPPAAASQASAPMVVASDVASQKTVLSTKPAAVKLNTACENLIGRMSRCYDRLPAESADEMKATLADVRASLMGTDENTCKNMSEEFNGTAAALGCE